jgi:anti-sigma regulatory factor (Ser/Thr protein kinase)
MARYAIRESLDIYEPRRAVRGYGASLGFSLSSCQELAIIVSELGSNIVKYGRSGAIEFQSLQDARYGVGIAIVADDVGPPFHDLSLALRDGYDDRGPIDPGLLMKRGGLGTGLGAVLRLSDSFEVEQKHEGKRITSARFLVRAPVSLKAKYGF